MLIVLTGMLAWHVQDRLYLLLPTLFVYGIFYVFILNGTHELSHNSVFKTKALNLFFLRLFSFFGFAQPCPVLGEPLGASQVHVASTG